MDTTSADMAAQTEIRQQVQGWQEAVTASDIDRIMSYYSSDVIAFDAVVQLQFKGAEAYKKHWEMCLTQFSGTMVFEVAELGIETTGDLGFGHALMRCGLRDESGVENVSWMRMTSGYRKTSGKWLIAHEHFSAPFDMHSGKALMDLSPDNTIKAVRPIPADMHSITPHLVCDGAAQAIEFYKKAFNATEVGRLPGVDGKILHAGLRIGDSGVMLADEFAQWGSFSPKSLKGTPVTVHLYVVDADKTTESAIAAGAKVIMPLADTFWGDRYGVLEDPFGHRWSVATHKRDVSPEEIQQGAQKACM